MSKVSFEQSAVDFECLRPLPAEATAAIRTALWTALGEPAPARLLEVGAGTGRIGRSFVAAGDAYVGIDLSHTMLLRFASGYPEGPAPTLAQADGEALPFGRAAFDAVLLAQVVSPLAHPETLLAEALRVLRPGGAVALGHIQTSPGSLDARLRDHLTSILADLGYPPPVARSGRSAAIAWLEARAARRICRHAADWSTVRSPRDFLERHRTGARFRTLPPQVRSAVAARLEALIAREFGDLSAPHKVACRYTLDLFFF